MPARYIEIRDDLQAKIASGWYQPGEILPTEVELAEAYGVSRPTMRHALQLLDDVGLLERRRHRGTMVLEPKIEQRFALRIRSFEREMHEANHVARTEVRLCEVCVAPQPVAERLSVAEGEAVVHLVRLRYADELPNVLVETYVPHRLYPGIETTDFVHESLYATMRTMGLPVVRAFRELGVAAADRSTAASLGIDAGAPVFVFHTVARAATGQAVEYSQATYRGDTNSFTLVAETD